MTRSDDLGSGSRRDTPNSLGTLMALAAGPWAQPAGPRRRHQQWRWAIAIAVIAAALLSHAGWRTEAMVAITALFIARIFDMAAELDD
jgi:hypothetical protein